MTDPARGRFDGDAGHRAVTEWTAFHAAAGNRIRGNRLSALHEYWGDARPAAGGAVGAP